jgi:hypothetical protein
VYPMGQHFFMGCICQFRSSKFSNIWVEIGKRELNPELLCCSASSVVQLDWRLAKGDAVCRCICVCQLVIRAGLVRPFWVFGGCLILFSFA